MRYLTHRNCPNADTRMYQCSMLTFIIFQQYDGALEQTGATFLTESDSIFQHKAKTLPNFQSYKVNLYRSVQCTLQLSFKRRELKMVQLSATRCSCVGFVSQSNEFYRHNPLCCFSTSVYCCKCAFRYRLSPETFGYTLVDLQFLSEKKNNKIAQNYTVIPACSAGIFFQTVL
jgi:hypothetical protein